MTPDELEKWRTGQKLTRKETAKRLGVSARTVLRWETGKGAIPALLRLAIAQIEAPINPAAEISALRKRLSFLIAERDKSLPELRLCRYRDCQKPLTGRKNKEFCSGKCRTREYLERKAEKAA